MRNDELKRFILATFRKGEFYGYKAHKILIQNEIIVEISRLYRVLNEMQKEGTLDYRWKENPSGPRRKLYSIGKKGLTKLDDILLDSVKTVHGFYTDYILDCPNNIAEETAKLVIAQVPVDGNIVYVSKEYSKPVMIMATIVQSMLPKGSHYIVSQKVDIDKRKPKTLLFLEGIYQNIPLKNNYADLIFVFNLMKKEVLRNFMTEIDRVMRAKGKLVLAVPTFLIDEYVPCMHCFVGLLMD